jgi:hypothetical protein
MINDSDIIVFSTAYPFSKKKNILLFFGIIVFGIILYFLPFRTSLHTNHTFNLIFSITVTLILLIIFLLDENIETLTINAKENKVEAVKSNVFEPNKIITLQYNNVILEYFSDNTRSGKNQILVLKDNNKIVKLESKRGFTIDKLNEIKKNIESYK